MPAVSDIEILEEWKKDLETYFRMHSDSLVANDAELGVRKWVLLIEDELQQLWLYKVGTGSFPDKYSPITQSLNLRIKLLVQTAAKAPEAFGALTTSPRN